MKFSVLMSVYAKEKPEYLEEALNSLINQTMMPDEIVIVKDGKLTPELDRVIDVFVNMPKYGHLFKIVPLSVNVGLGLALNAGIEACSYDLIARADSDDISTADRFEKQVLYMIANQNVSMISSNIVEYDEDMSTIVGHRRVPETTQGIRDLIKQRNPFNHMAVMYRKKDLVEVGGYEHCPYFEDYYLWLKLYSKGGDFYNFQPYLVNARTGISMLSRRGGVKYTKSILYFYVKSKRENLISRQDLIKGLARRVPVAIAPNWLRSYVYMNHLRKAK